MEISSQPSTSEQLSSWQDAVAGKILRVLLWVGPVAVAFSMARNYEVRDWVDAVTVVAAYVTIVVVLLLGRHAQSLRAPLVVGLTYLVGAEEVLQDAPHGTGFPMLLAASILSGLLLSSRAAWLCCAGIIATASGAIAGHALGLLHIIRPTPSGLAWWLDETTAFTLVALATFLPQGYIVRRLVDSIEEGRRRRDDLAVSELRFRQAMEASNDGLWEWDVQTGQTYYSPAYCRMLGYEPGGLPTSVQSWIERIHPDDKEKAWTANQNCIDHLTESFETEFRLRTRSGAWKWVLDRGKAAERDASGRAIRMIGTHTDITTRKQTEEELKDKERTMSLILDSISEHFIYQTPDHRILWANKAAAKSVGLTPDDLKGRHCYSLWGRPEGECEYCPFREVKSTSQPHQRDITSPDGRSWNVRGYPVLDAHGRTEALIEVTTEITERKRMEAEAKAEERRLQALLRISQFSPKQPRELLDMALEEVVQLSGSEYGYIFHYDEDARKFTVHAWSQAVMRDCSVDNPPHVYDLDQTGIWGEPVRQRRAIVLNDFAAAHPAKKGYPDGHVKLRRFATVPVFSGGRIVGVTGVANKPTDYTDADIHRLTLMMDGVWKTIERSRLLEQLQQINAELEQRVKERTAVAEERAAQLRVLAGRLTMAENQERRRVAHILHEHFQQLLASVKLHLAVVRRKIRDSGLESIIRQIDEALDESIRTSRSLSVELYPPILYDLGLAATLEWLGRWMRDKYHLDVAVQADPQANPQAEDVSILLFRAARELLFNCVKHARVNQATVRMSCQDPQSVEVVVADKGAGFDPSSLASGIGTSGGFGLFSIRERIKLIGGSMQVDSRPGRGTRIRLVAPIGHAEPDDPGRTM